MLAVNQQAGFGTKTWDGDENTLLLLHFDGLNNSTNIIDSSMYARPISVFADAKISTAQSVFGGSSGSFDGTGDYMTVPDSPDWDLGTSDFTVDWWLRMNSLTGTQTIFTRRVGSNNFATFHAIFNPSGSNNIQFAASTNGSSFDIVNQNFGVPVVNTWAHWAITRSGSTFRLFKDGTQTTSFTNSGSLMSDSSPIQIAAQQAGSFVLNGYIDEFRISNVARWTGAFTPPSAPYF